MRRAAFTIASVPTLAQALALLAAPAGADTLKVPGDFATIQAAIDAAQPGDTIDVAKGTYAEAVVFLARTNITMRGKGFPRIDGGGGAVPLCIDGSTDITILGFVLANGAPASVDVAGSTRATILKCTIDGGTTGIRATQCSELVIAKCKIADTQDDGIHGEGLSLGTIEKNSIADTGGDGIALSEDAVTTTTSTQVSKNKIVRATGTSLHVEGDDNEIVSNQVSDGGGVGVVVGRNGGGAGNAVQKNKVVRGAGDAYRIGGSEALVEKNQTQDSGDEGFDVVGNQHRFLKNKILRCDDEGFEISDSTGSLFEKNVVVQAEDDAFDIRTGTSACTFRMNVVAKPSDAGFEIDGTGHLFESNKVAKAGEYGFDVETGGHTFTKNTAGGSGLIDLRSDVPENANTYSGNKFKTTEFAP